jgi:NADH:ubiquinone oxidoreductase subunit 4 (subunit M)
MGLETLSSILLLLVGASTFITVVYSLLMFNRVSFGTVKMQYIITFSDLTRREFFLMLPLVIFNFLFGLCPNLFIGPIYYGIL